MNADEIVRELRAAQEKYKNDIVSTGRIRIDAMARDCANCIESLQAENRALNACKDKLVEQNKRVIRMLGASQRRAQDARNELCLKCGRYHEAHNGSCDGCRWKEG